MCAHSLTAAREAGFAAMQFNFVVATNTGAIRLWRAARIRDRRPSSRRVPARGAGTDRRSDHASRALTAARSRGDFNAYLEGKDRLHFRRVARHRPRDRHARRGRRRQHRHRREDRHTSSQAAGNDLYRSRGRSTGGAAAGARALPVVCDIRDEASVAGAVDAAVKEFGGIDVLVNNASAISLTGTLATPMKRFDLMFGVNVRGTFLCSQACLPHLRAAAAAGRNPHILTLSPPLNLDPKWFRDHVAYTIAKYGMTMCVIGMAEEFRADGIAVNALWPRSVIATAAIAMIPGAAEQTDRMRTPEIVADAAQALLTRDARTTTGQCFIDEDVLAAAGVTDLARYAVKPGTAAAAGSLPGLRDRRRIPRRTCCPRCRREARPSREAPPSSPDCAIRIRSAAVAAAAIAILALRPDWGRTPGRLSAAAGPSGPLVSPARCRAIPRAPLPESSASSSHTAIRRRLACPAGALAAVLARRPLPARFRSAESAAALPAESIAALSAKRAASRRRGHGREIAIARSLLPKMLETGRFAVRRIAVHAVAGFDDVRSSGGRSASAARGAVSSWRGAPSWPCGPGRPCPCGRGPRCFGPCPACRGLPPWPGRCCGAGPSSACPPRPAPRPLPPRSIPASARASPAGASRSFRNACG